MLGRIPIEEAYYGGSSTKVRELISANIVLSDFHAYHQKTKLFCEPKEMRILRLYSDINEVIFLIK